MPQNALCSLPQLSHLLLSCSVVSPGISTKKYMSTGRCARKLGVKEKKIIYVSRNGYNAKVKRRKQGKKTEVVSHSENNTDNF
jgi:hypothetical protein